LKVTTEAIGELADTLMMLVGERPPRTDRPSAPDR